MSRDELIIPTLGITDATIISESGYQVDYDEQWAISNVVLNLMHPMIGVYGNATGGMDVEYYPAIVRLWQGDEPNYPKRDKISSDGISASRSTMIEFINLDVVSGRPSRGRTYLYFDTLGSAHQWWDEFIGIIHRSIQEVLKNHPDIVKSPRFRKGPQIPQLRLASDHESQREDIANLMPDEEFLQQIIDKRNKKEAELHRAREEEEEKDETGEWGIGGDWWKESIERIAELIDESVPADILYDGLGSYRGQSSTDMIKNLIDRQDVYKHEAQHEDADQDEINSYDYLPHAEDFSELDQMDTVPDLKSKLVTDKDKFKEFKQRPIRLSEISNYLPVIKRFGLSNDETNKHKFYLDTTGPSGNMMLSVIITPEMWTLHVININDASDMVEPRYGWTPEELAASLEQLEYGQDHPPSHVSKMMDEPPYYE